LRTAGQMGTDKARTNPNPAAPSERVRLQIDLFICHKG